MKLINGMIGGVAAMLIGGAASAATLTIDTFVSTNAVALNPVVTINDDTPGQFDVSLSLTAPEFGDVVALFFDLSPALSNAQLATLSAVSTMPAVPVGLDFKFKFENGIDAATNDDCENNILSGGLPLPTFEGYVCYRSTGPAKPTAGVNPVEFSILDPGGLLSLASFDGVGIRYKSSSNPGGSDKLFGTPGVIPLPAAGWLLIAGLGGMAALGRRRSA